MTFSKGLLPTVFVVVLAGAAMGQDIKACVASVGQPGRELP